MYDIFIDSKLLFQSLRFTDCLWAAVEMNKDVMNREHETEEVKLSTNHANSIICVVKVLKECLQPIKKANEENNEVPFIIRHSKQKISFPF
jgi:hypothetical protein